MIATSGLVGVVLQLQRRSRPPAFYFLYRKCISNSSLQFSPLESSTEIIKPYHMRIRLELMLKGLIGQICYLKRYKFDSEKFVFLEVDN